MSWSGCTFQEISQVFTWTKKREWRVHNFAEFTIPELIQKIWKITDALKNNYRVRYLFWLPSCKVCCEEYLKEKWKPSCLPNLKSILKRIDDQNLMYCPGAYVDSEKCMEFLVRVKEIRTKSLLQIRTQIRHQGVVNL